MWDVPIVMWSATVWCAAFPFTSVKEEIELGEGEEEEEVERIGRWGRTGVSGGWA